MISFLDIRAGIVLLILNFYFSFLFGQDSGSEKDLRALYAETKQVNQFFRRFNNEESVSGERYYSQKDSLFRNPVGRAKYLEMLFDLQSKSIDRELKKDFLNEITSKTSPRYLDFHGGDWWAEVTAEFLLKGREERITMFLRLQEEKVGSKWVIFAVSSPSFNVGKKDTSSKMYFIHPMSHETDFMNLQRIFQEDKVHIEEYASREYEADPLALFFHEVKVGNLRFQNVSGVSFHFFQIRNWYFEISYLNRSGYNTGWLITSLAKVGKNQRRLIENFILGKE